jgi:hypothetical protein
MIIFPFRPPPIHCPVTMDEWQNRLRAQKKQDRENKSQSAEILHNYRGGIKDEDEIQKKIRLEEQQKKKDAEQFLRSYRPDADAVDSHVPKRETCVSSPTKFGGPLSEVVHARGKDDPRNSITAGAVSSIAANFTGSSTRTSPHTPSKPMRATWERPDPPTEDDAAKSCSVGGLSGSFTDVGSYHSNDNNNNKDHEWVQVTSEEIRSEGFPPGPKETFSMALPVFDHKTATTNDLAVEDGSNPFLDLEDTTPENPAADVPTNTPFGGAANKEAIISRSDISFSFGLISTTSQRSLDPYMQAVQGVVQSALAENAEMGEMITISTSDPPFVQSIQSDGKSQ